MGERLAVGTRNAVRILIVDDHPLVREGLAALISTQPDLAVCGEAAGYTEAVGLAETTRPDLIIVDISLKDGDGIDLIRRIKAQNGSVRFLVSSMHDELIYAERALRAGALGYVGKHESTQRILDAIRRVLANKVYLTESTADRFLHTLVAGSVKRSPVEKLADRELQVFELLGQGLSTRQIAAQLHLSSKTVDTYRGRIRQKLQLGRGGALTRYAMQWSLKPDQGSPGA
jgi:DNA-binding NarL/FixJ family response regulator